MTEFGEHSPRRYFVDAEGRRVLIGLSLEETFEFETIDGPSALGEIGKQVAGDKNGVARERRWLELYSKHDSAWTQWKIELP